MSGVIKDSWYDFGGEVSAPFTNEDIPTIDTSPSKDDYLKDYNETIDNIVDDRTDVTILTDQYVISPYYFESDQYRTDGSGGVCSIVNSEPVIIPPAIITTSVPSEVSCYITNSDCKFLYETSHSLSLNYTAELVTVDGSALANILSLNTSTLGTDGKVYIEADFSLLSVQYDTSFKLELIVKVSFWDETI